MYSIGICSASFAKADSDQRYEALSLIEEARKLFDDIIIINPKNLSFSFEGNIPQVYCGNNNISNINCLFVYSTLGYSKTIAVLVHTLNLLNCTIFDPIERFTGRNASKLLTTISRFKRKAGSNSYYAFSLHQIPYLIEKLKFPVISKPINGRQGKGIVLLNSKEEVIAFSNEFFVSVEKDTPIFFQEYTDFEHEYRVMMFEGVVLSIMEKHKKDGEIAANMARGGIFVPVYNYEIEEFVINNCSNKGLLGIDVGVAKDNKIFLIEENRAPQWQNATPINIAKQVMFIAYNACYYKKEK